MEKNQEEYDLENPFGLETKSDFHLIRKDVTISILKEYVSDTAESCILDVGCGRGNITKCIKQNFASTKLDAIDISQTAINLASQEITGVNFLIADAATYSSNGILYDAIVLNNIYEHVESPIQILNNLRSLLKKDGVFIISTPNRYHLKNTIKILVGGSIKIPAYHITEYSIGQIYDYHNYCNLQIEKIVSPVFKYEKFKLTNFIVFRLLRPLIDEFLKLRKSKNKMGSLLFVISKLKQ